LGASKTIAASKQRCFLVVSCVQEFIVNVPFPEDSQRVLRVMIRRPVISGGELGILTGIPSDQLSQALRPLLSAGIISTGTSTLGSAEIGISYFNLNPSARPLAEYAAG
jgi:hypothetical protein